MTYDQRQALKDSLALASCSSLVEFCECIEHYMAGEQVIHEVERSAKAVVLELWRRALPPERAIAALRMAACGVLTQPLREDRSAYDEAIRIMLRLYFASPKADLAMRAPRL